ncbi:hypothetical protein H6G27_18915 [Nostoc linckia FACHB-104]|nr:hypothetical protein [Nostoc linckia FACHB-104]
MNIFENISLTSVISPLILLAILLGMRYIATTRAVGYQNASRELLYALPWFLVYFILGFFVSRLINYESLSFLIVYAVFLAISLIYLLTWNWRKQQAGYLLLDSGFVLRNKRLVWLSLITMALAAFYSTLFIDAALSGVSLHDNVHNSYFTGAIILWTSVILLISRGFSRLEFRENGICYMFSLLKWEKLRSYRWEKSGNNVLIVGFDPSFFLVRSYWRLVIPVTDKDAVNEIIAYHLNKRTQILSSSASIQK